MTPLLLHYINAQVVEVEEQEEEEGETHDRSTFLTFGLCVCVHSEEGMTDRVLRRILNCCCQCKHPHVERGSRASAHTSFEHNPVTKLFSIIASIVFRLAGICGQGLSISMLANVFLMP